MAITWKSVGLAFLALAAAAWLAQQDSSAHSEFATLTRPRAPSNAFAIRTILMPPALARREQCTQLAVACTSRSMN
jgi:hypothetical protein